MDEKKRDCVLSVALFAIGAYVTIESCRMLGRAALPPFRIDKFSISPGMFPAILGALLVLFSILLAVGGLRGEARPGRVFLSRLGAAAGAARAAFADADFLSMLVGVAMMFAYCFFMIGNLPFWGGAVVFLLAMTTFLRAAGPAARFLRETGFGAVLLTTLAVVSAVVVLFEDVFGTILP